jgi:L-asparaginase
MVSGAELASAAGCHFDEIVPLSAVASWDLSLADMVAIARAVAETIDAGYRSVIVTHGTDTIEETAWLTDLLLGPERRANSRVLFTGAMRFADAPHSDGSANLRFCHDELQRSGVEPPGVQVGFAGHLHAARWVTKHDAAALDPFSSGGRPSASGPLPATTGDINMHVALVAHQPIPPGAEGVVLRGTGAGHVPSRYDDDINALISAGTPVVVATRTRDVERVVEPTSACLRAGDLSAEKAALALAVALGTSRQMPDVRAFWHELSQSSRR